MVRFDELRSKASKHKPIEPIEIFRRLPKPEGVNDLYTSQAEVLKAWFSRRNERDTVLKLHTGGGKTLVGLLMAQSSLNETGEPVLYLTPTTQLVSQTLEKARAYGIPAVAYGVGSGVPLDEQFRNGSAIMIATYAALFHGKSKFKLRGHPEPVKTSAVVLDDAHTAFGVVRDAYSIQILAGDEPALYKSMTEMFRLAFQDVGKLGTFDDITAGADFGVLEVPYWAWRERLEAVTDLMKANLAKHELRWPLLRDNLRLCHGLVGRDAFTITPALPLVNALPTFFEAPRRIYMSATIADDSEIVRTFDVSVEAVRSPLTSRSLAGVSERMILIPELMPFEFDARVACERLLIATAERRMGAVVLAPSKPGAAAWSSVAGQAPESKDVEPLVRGLQLGTTFGPVAFANRYDGIDLPGNACRLLVLDGLPTGTSDYDRFKASALYGGGSTARLLAQRIEQGIGRGARGAGDHCVVVLLGGALAAWIAKAGNARFLTSATRAQLEMGAEVSRSVSDGNDLNETINKSFARDRDWIAYHAERLAELVDETPTDTQRFELAAAERAAVNLWQDGHFEKAVVKIEKALEKFAADPQSTGFLNQLAARIADAWGHLGKAEELQNRAYSTNRNMMRPSVVPPYRALTVPGSQSTAIASRVSEYHPRRGLLRAFDEAVVHLTKEASANQFEQALADLGGYLGLASERHDEGGLGPDVLWLLPTKVGVVIEAKSRKYQANALRKAEHGQLLVAQKWFEAAYPGYTGFSVSVHPSNLATKAASAQTSYAFTYEQLQLLVSDLRRFLAQLCDSTLEESHLAAECESKLSTVAFRADRLVDRYLSLFREQ